MDHSRNYLGRREVHAWQRHREEECGGKGKTAGDAAAPGRASRLNAVAAATDRVSRLSALNTSIQENQEHRDGRATWALLGVGFVWKPS